MPKSHTIDKAGIASVMEASVHLLESDLTGTGAAHGDLYLSFVPDEEIGLLGVRTMDMARFPVDYAYTLDSCELGEIVEATFNAGHAHIEITGVTAHPMNAKGNLVNPILLAQDFIAQLDHTQTPENAEGREGYLWVNGSSGNQARATLDISIRDHERTGYEAKKDLLRSIAEKLADTNPRATITLDITDVYSNIEDAKTPDNQQATDRLLATMKNLGVEPLPLAMRGGTDGSWLSAQGIFTPNFFTGAHNFHSIYEFLPMPSFEKSCLMVQELMKHEG
ncbi:peptidase T [Rothia sp. (in: high G+C Gram-positive bacteria)]|uniref:peptidase T n=2 Tax=unclassified Rothia (in: high G+C Gram-positive bacteria) TaxID=2689056 RepID=UPI00321677A1